MTEALLSVDGLQVVFRTDEGTVRAVDGVSFDVRPGETVCLVGESGAGKTVTCEAITRLIPIPPGGITGGTITFAGQDLTAASGAELREIRGDRIAHAFQNPQNLFDPVYTVGAHLVEAIRYHRDVPKGRARSRAVDLLHRVGIPNSRDRVDDYPHEFSGGMKQRVMLALALANDPDLLITDEPTTAVDVTMEAQILELLADLQAERDMAILFVTHDLGVVAEIADRVVVMYAGEVMERGDVRDTFKEPAHPYTRALFRSMPGQGRRMEPIGGHLPDPRDQPSGCRFHPRCPHAIDACEAGDQPPLHRVAEGHEASCVFYGPDHDAAALSDDRRPGQGAPRAGRPEGDDGGAG
jgi:peptide/nickel transport system ATP-binding protein